MENKNIIANSAGGKEFVLTENENQLVEIVAEANFVNIRRFEQDAKNAGEEISANIIKEGVTV